MIAIKGINGNIDFLVFTDNSQAVSFIVIVISVFLLESIDLRKKMFCYDHEDGVSVLTNRFMTIAERKHSVPKLSRRVFFVFFPVLPFVRFELFVFK